MRVLVPLLLALASPAAAQALQTPAEALAQDAAEYARQHHVEPDEALRRLHAQEETVAATDRLRATYAKRLAGMFIEHEPAYRIVVLLKGGKAVPDEAIEAAGMIVPIVFRTGAPATRDKILKAIAKRGDRLRAAFPDARGMGADPRTGELVLMVGDTGKSAEDLADMAGRASDIAGVRARIRPIEAAADLAAVEGGARVEGADAVTGRHAVCTAGFVVTDGARTGLVTAAHCPDVLTYIEPDGAKVELPFVGQWGWSFQDVQVNVADGGGEPLFYVDAKKSAARVPEGVRPRASTRAGDFVCHRGERTGYTCGEVELTDFAPPGALCGGPCAASWVTVAGPGCGGGDSGGPVFAGDTAFGIMKGGTWTKDGRCAFYYYMSLDYLPDGWRLATRADSRAAPETEPTPRP
ncbi:MAG: streptogrisin [Sphingomonadales bacterium]|nr:streptogrisin [Sphingomonadales bacterium]